MSELELQSLRAQLNPHFMDDIARTIQKIKNELHQQQNNINVRLEQLEKLLLQKATSLETKIGIGMSHKIVFVHIPDILYCEAQGAYTNVYLKDNRKMMVSKSLGDFEAQLAIHKFLRIHHHFLINLNHVKEFQHQEWGFVIMDNEKQLDVSQWKRKEFRDEILDIMI